MILGPAEYFARLLLGVRIFFAHTHTHLYTFKYVDETRKIVRILRPFLISPVPLSSLITCKWVLLNVLENETYFWYYLKDNIIIKDNYGSCRVVFQIRTRSGYWYVFNGLLDPMLLFRIRIQIQAF